MKVLVRTNKEKGLSIEIIPEKPTEELMIEKFGIGKPYGGMKIVLLAAENGFSLAMQHHTNPDALKSMGELGLGPLADR